MKQHNIFSPDIPDLDLTLVTFLASYTSLAGASATLSTDSVDRSYHVTGTVMAGVAHNIPWTRVTAVGFTTIGGVYLRAALS